jgi:hypothetical protein
MKRQEPRRRSVKRGRLEHEIQRAQKRDEDEQCVDGDDALKHRFAP